ncbi:hypothetical protein GX48_07764 [Paracoccidioides brasiliensis]|nr:hypothetical protein GX48_07764 [Paracoccidioides brasiliensis]
MVESRKSRWSYGIGVHRAFDPDLDSDGNEDSFPANGMRVTGCIQWLIRWVRKIGEVRAVSSLFTIHPPRDFNRMTASKRRPNGSTDV